MAGPPEPSADGAQVTEVGAQPQEAGGGGGSGGAFSGGATSAQSRVRGPTMRGFLDRSTRSAAPAASQTSAEADHCAAAKSASAAHPASAATECIASGATGTSTAAADAPQDRRGGTAVQSARSGAPTALTTALLPAPPSDTEGTRRAAFLRLQPLCAALLPLRAAPRPLASALAVLQGSMAGIEPRGLQACMDYVMFPLMHVVDSIAALRAQRPPGGAPQYLFYTI